MGNSIFVSLGFAALPPPKVCLSLKALLVEDTPNKLLKAAPKIN